MTSAFGVGSRKSLELHELAGIRVKLTRALRAGKKLQRDFSRWRAETTLATIATRVPGDDRRLSVSVSSTRLFPHDAGSASLGELTLNTRSALNQLNQLMFTRFGAADFDARRVEFPLTDNGKDWRSWKQGHRAAPEWLRDRYERIQPLRGPYRGLLGLRELNDEDKHRELSSIHVALVGSLGAGSITVDGPNREIRPKLDAGDNLLHRDTKSVRVGTMTWPTRVIDFEAEIVSKAEVELQFDIGDGFYAIVGASALGPVPKLAAQPRDTAQARSALVAAKRIVEEQDTFAVPRAGRARPQVIPNDRNRL